MEKTIFEGKVSKDFQNQLNRYRIVKKRGLHYLEIYSWPENKQTRSELLAPEDIKEYIKENI